MGHSDDHCVTDGTIEDTLNEESLIADGDMRSDTSSTDSYFEDVVYLKAQRSPKQDLKSVSSVDECGRFVEPGDSPLLRELKALEIVQEHPLELQPCILQELES